uniref:Uncharacterized protein n=1 Tax=Attheya septentrionalis TaxID=420275 RepID=A0A6T7G6D2_9STRA|mmetsp:Transcript_12416/g.22514  ORF Transcript_12416/g.22514 Transcript_12416/m.22514 type:complete len:452 (+) Transcript_12416:268-1623(+)|eukprot:CAMPEP_0198298418 /NCGR_PEP_ID=MMETSP1449-20131203/40868_1 /TAXON_ID=420275 /ORGANISM="Attheya septentrionalis, Strain CCMP2084" /LENGTH=451 /DNA_ID=CAMNT_0043999677 /DNA_START=237 /DNA_END=1595 /DNA_ORIENTATION=-
MLRQMSRRLGMGQGDDDTVMSSATAPSQFNSTWSSGPSVRGLFGRGGEREDLEQQIRTRDNEIKDRSRTLSANDRSLARLQEEVDTERLSAMEDIFMHRIEYERIERHMEGIERRIITLDHDTKDLDAVHEYADLIKSVAPKSGVDSAYVLKLKSQLAKAVKKMDGTTEQIAQVERSCDEVVASLQTEIKEVVADRCKTELDLKKQVEDVEMAHEAVEQELTATIAENRRTLGKLQKKLKRREKRSGTLNASKDSLNMSECSVSSSSSEGEGSDDEWEGLGNEAMLQKLKDQLKSIQDAKNLGQHALSQQLAEKNKELQTHTNAVKQLDAAIHNNDFSLLPPKLGKKSSRRSGKSSRSRQRNDWDASKSRSMSTLPSGSETGTNDTNNEDNDAFGFPKKSFDAHTEKKSFDAGFASTDFGGAPSTFDSTSSNFGQGFPSLTEEANEDEDEE